MRATNVTPKFQMPSIKSRVESSLAFATKMLPKIVGLKGNILGAIHMHNPKNLWCVLDGT